MTKGIFITGSGTGVGKTFISGMMLREFLRMGYRATYMKPVETGCEYCPSDMYPNRRVLIGADTRNMLDITEYKANVSLHSPYRFVPACSPHLAARMTDLDIKTRRISSTYRALCRRTSAEVVIAEGAGGILAPINDKEYMADVISALGLPVVLVTGARLGTLNHTFLSVNELKRRGIRIVGAVITNANGIEHDYICDDNKIEIAKYVAPAPCLVVNYNDHDNPNLTEFCNEVLSRV